MSIGATTALAGTFTDLSSTGNTTLGDAVADNITLNGKFVNGTILRSAQAATNTLALAAYDVDGVAYTNLITLTASNTPTLDLTSTGVGTINNMSIGATTPATGAFTTLSATGAITANTTTNNQSYTTTGAGTITISSGTAGTINNMSIGATTALAGTFTNLSATGNVTLGDAVADTITVNGQFVTGTVLRSAQAATNTLALAAYDVDGTAYTNLITLTASNTPTLVLTSTGTGSIDNMTIGATTASTGAFTTLTATAAGKLGVGVASPTRLLDMSGNATVGAIAFLTTTTGANTAYYAASNTGGAVYFGRENSAGNTFSSSSGYASVLWAEGAYPLIFATNNAARAQIDSVGNMQFQAGAVMPYAPAPAAVSAAETLTNAKIQGQIISATGTTYTITMPLGTTMETLATWATTNIAYDFFVINTASGTVTMAINTGVTSLGSLTIATGVSAHFRIRRTAANTFVLYRLV
jgi:hypothetical protein